MQLKTMDQEIAFISQIMQIKDYTFELLKYSQQLKKQIVLVANSSLAEILRNKIGKNLKVVLSLPKSPDTLYISNNENMNAQFVI